MPTSSPTLSKLALHGGSKVRTKPFPPYKTIGDEEKTAVDQVMDSGILSRFLGCWHDDFYGGPQVQAFEQAWAKHFQVKHAISVNSATSALYAAIGAIGIEPGDEVVVSPYTMSASATAPLVYGAIPIFADIEPDYFCLDPASVEANITSRTKAIVVVDIFGLPYDRDAINDLAQKHGLKVIEDCAQAPGAYHQGKAAGTLADIGIYSLNYHKHIHTGEGGVLVTDDDVLAERLRLIRNHAEAVVDGKPENDYGDLAGLVGFNYRMTEIEAAIGQEQLKKLDGLIQVRQDNVAYLTEKLQEIPCLTPAATRPGCTHAYYQHPILFDAEVAGVHRNTFVQAVQAELAPIELREAEGVKVNVGYVKPLYWQSLYQTRQAFGKGGYPWSAYPESKVSYERGLCPITEKLHLETMIHHELMRPGLSQEDLDDVVTAFSKVWENRHALKESNDGQ
ncbi:MAG: DegT/DnrJ/EryC1/StrS family aminotransferase [Vampirovibrio sp.]|nr:DegT/DnrJ/EryC1/StrS family aminotransferase [Vampirovibrio sp.]